MAKPSSLAPIRRRSVEGEVYQRLREAILRGELLGGERLIHEDLAKRFGTSRIPVRDALKRLASDGLVNLDERGVATVSRCGLEDIEEIYTLRVLLESHAVAKAVARITVDELTELETLQHHMEAAIARGDRDDYVMLNQQFHTQLYDIAAQPRLGRMIQSLWQGLPPLTPIAITTRLKQSIDEHRRIIAALRKRDAEAASAAMARHIEAAGAALTAYITRKGKGLR